MWDIRGWKRLTVHNDPPLFAAREEILSWLEEAPEPFKTQWKSRLTSPDDHPHLSARLELFLHHYLRSSGWQLEIEPSITQNGSRPEFRASKNNIQFVVEAKTLLDNESITKETQRLHQLADNLSSKLSCTVMIGPLDDLPPSLPYKEIARNIEKHVVPHSSDVQRIKIAGSHQGDTYALEVIALPLKESLREPLSIGGLMSQAHWLDHKERIRKALNVKARKYGAFDLPFVIALSCDGEFPITTNDEFDALFGSIAYQISNLNQAKWIRQPNGFFGRTSKGPKNQNVSAILFYRLKWHSRSHIHQMHLYHNPFALFPLPLEIFPSIPQMVFDKNGKPTWINGEPD